ncbi:hypothetical protein KDW_06650 [Dictyobacter vulcani]|uniref:YtkA-like domain-containing protein n=1 Tax=Dictyobacter vulcani TaxID=2607529 RepID=A0A5J4KFR9_9CHLR|nr:FixH family protein [Dictyobacter vulcani]GER86503.1 hypothetical protein KDW_06650 [Dictyobacter vulcani]
MHIRPFFWFVLLIACVSTLALAFFYQPYSPAFLQVHITQKQFVSTGQSSLELHFSDPDGLPIDQAQVIPSAHMTNMDMTALQSNVVPHGHGIYEVKLALNMSGPWSITVKAQAQGFIPQKQTLQVTVL